VDTEITLLSVHIYEYMYAFNRLPPQAGGYLIVYEKVGIQKNSNSLILLIVATPVSVRLEFSGRIKDRYNKWVVGVHCILSTLGLSGFYLLEI
jgi:hypothetical protein